MNSACRPAATITHNHQMRSCAGARRRPEYSAIAQQQQPSCAPRALGCLGVRSAPFSRHHCERFSPSRSRLAFQTCARTIPEWSSVRLHTHTHSAIYRAKGVKTNRHREAAYAYASCHKFQGILAINICVCVFVCARIINCSSPHILSYV